jgi:nucleotide-binding universal stress UspA family protein
MAKLRPDHILVPVAMSRACRWAADYGSQLAHQFDTRLSFVHVGGTPLQDVVAFLGETGANREGEVTVCNGDPAEVITQIARERESVWLVMGTHAHGKFRRFLLGSVTARVLHDVDCPVLTGVHRETIPLPARADIRHVVCAIDSDEGFASVIRGAAEIGLLLHSQVTPIHAVPAADELSDNAGEIEVRKFLFRLATEKFSRLQRELGVAANIALAGGPVAKVVREAVLRTNADLVVIGRGHTQRGLGRLRTNTYSVIRSSPCPVLSI